MVQRKKNDKTEPPVNMDKVQRDPSVQEALKKEKQPVSTEDLSPLHNNNSSGTTGADQREPEINDGKLSQNAKKEIRPQK